MGRTASTEPQCLYKGAIYFLFYSSYCATYCTELCLIFLSQPPCYCVCNISHDHRWCKMPHDTWNLYICKSRSSFLCSRSLLCAQYVITSTAVCEQHRHKSQFQLLFCKIQPMEPLIKQIVLSYVYIHQNVRNPIFHSFSIYSRAVFKLFLLIKRCYL
jgi:hypothetical protein